MLHRLRNLALAALVIGLGQLVAAPAADLTDSLKPGSVELKSSGPLAFGPDGILFIGDPVAAAIYAVDTGDRTASTSATLPKVEGINEKIASLLGTEAKGIQVKDIAVNKISGNAYLAVARGSGPKATPVVVKVTRDGKLSEFDLGKVKSARADMTNANTKADKTGASAAITHLAYLNGRILVAGMSTEEFSSNLRSIPFPFDKTDNGSSVRIYHGAHGRFETNSPIRVFAHYKIGDQDHILAAYTCTPLVKLPVAQLKPGEKLNAVTVAELGNMNRPLSMIVYNKGGKDYVLMSNSARGMMKIGLDGVDKIEGITSKISKTAGLKYDTINELKGVQKLDAYDKDHAVVLVQQAGGKLDLQTIELP